MKFWDYSTHLPAPIDWMFSLHHIYLLIGLMISITVFALIFKRCGKKARRGILLFVGIALVVLELLRILWNILSRLQDGNGVTPSEIWWSVSFQMCAIMVWFTAVSLIMNNKKWNRFAYPMMFGGAMIGASLAFLYPDMISVERSIWHFKNIQTVVTHGLLICVPILLISSGMYRPRFKDLIFVFIGYAGTALIAGTASILSGHNFMFMRKLDLFDPAVLFPYNLFVLAAIWTGLLTHLFLPFEIHNSVKAKKAAKLKETAAA